MYTKCSVNSGGHMNTKPFREILVFVAGSTPQIITETIQAMALRHEPLHMDDIFIITTNHNRQKIVRTLVEEGRLAAMCREWNIPPLHISDSSFVILSDQEGNPLDDIRSADENELAGDLIAGFLRDKASDPGTRLHCSLAGGRKTMSFYMGLAFQLFARQWDRLYHVMVSPDFELLEDFYYKPRENQIIQARRRDGSQLELHTDRAVITLTELPQICLRDKLPPTSGGVRELVAQGQKSIDSSSIQLPVTVNLSERTLYIGPILIELPPAQLALYTAFLRLKLGPCKFSGRDYCQECIACFIPLVDMSSEPFLEAMADDYKAIYGGDELKRDDQLEKWQNSLDSSNLRQQISKVNRVLKEELADETMHPFYLISCNKKYGGSRYGIRVEKGKIQIFVGDARYNV